MRDAFSASLIDAAISDPRIVLFTGDHGYALFDEFRRVCPDRYFNAGVAEQNMVGVAAGMAKAGYIPFVYGLSAFVPIRVLEQIKLDVCYEELPVIFIGDGAGVVYSSLGSSHQSTEDIAALRAIPNIAIFSPCDGEEMRLCMSRAVSLERPVYLRMGKADLGNIHPETPTIGIGDLCPIRPGNGDIGFIATGSMVKVALEVAEIWPDSSVWSAPFIKPLDDRVILDRCRQHKILVVLEEHSIYGGLGSAIAEIAAAGHPTRICRIGIEDRFSRYCGSYRYLMEEHGLDERAIVTRIKDFLETVPK
jgi:transketolase